MKRKHYWGKVCVSLLLIVLTICGTVVLPSAAIAYEASLIRIGGKDRYDTANRIASEGWSTASTVILASGQSFPDALAGAPLSHVLDAPILLVGKDSIPQSVMDRIYSLGARNIYILGGSAAISDKVEMDLHRKNFNVTRIAGSNRYETAAQIAEKIDSIRSSNSIKDKNELFIVSGENYPDALSVSSIAAIYNSPILFSNKKGTIDDMSLDYIQHNWVSKVYVIGGESAVGSEITTNLTRHADVSASKIERISGASRYETSLKTAEFFKDRYSSKQLAFATGTNYPDALAGGAFAAKLGIPVLLTNSNYVASVDNGFSAAAYDDSMSFVENLVHFVAMMDPHNTYVLGGENALATETVESYLAAAERLDVPHVIEISGRISTRSNITLDREIKVEINEVKPGDKCYQVCGNWECGGTTLVGMNADSQGKYSFLLFPDQISEGCEYHICANSTYNSAYGIGSHRKVDVSSGEDIKLDIEFGI